MKTPKFSFSENLNITIQKGFSIQKCQPNEKDVHVYMHSILGRGSFCMNYCINARWHGGDQLVALLRCYGSPGRFDSGLQLFCFVGSGVS